MPKELTTEVVRGCLYTWMLIGRLDGRTPPEITLITSLIFKFWCNNTICQIYALHEMAEEENVKLH